MPATFRLPLQALLLIVLALAAVAIVPTAARSADVSLSAEQLKINQRIAQAALIRADAIEAHLDGREFTPQATSAGKPVTLSLSQLKINQRIAQAAVRKVNALLAKDAGRPAPQPKAKHGKAKFTLSVGQLRISQRITQAAVRRVNALAAQLGIKLPSSKPVPQPSVTPTAGNWPAPRITIGKPFQIAKRTTVRIRATVPAGGRLVVTIDKMTPRRTVRTAPQSRQASMDFKIKTSPVPYKGVTEGVNITATVFDASDVKLSGKSILRYASYILDVPPKRCPDYQVDC